MKAKYIKDIALDSMKGKLFSLSSPHETFSNVIVAAFISPGYMGEPMTLILPSNAAGELLSWQELAGSQAGVLDYTRVLNDLGYVVEV